MRRIKRNIVGAVLLSKDGKVLLGRSAARAVGVYSGRWVVPGGGVDKDETLEQALVREILEETHHDINGCHIKLVSNTEEGESEKRLKETGELVIVEMKFNDYLVRLEQTAEELGVRPSEELVELRWFSMDELKEALLSPPTDRLLKALRLKD